VLISRSDDLHPLENPWWVTNISLRAGLTLKEGRNFCLKGHPSHQSTHLLSPFQHRSESFLLTARALENPHYSFLTSLTSSGCFPPFFLAPDRINLFILDKRTFGSKASVHVSVPWRSYDFLFPFSHRNEPSHILLGANLRPLPA